MSPMHNLNAVRFVCDGPVCDEEALIPFRPNQPIPDGWSYVVIDQPDGSAFRVPFHSYDCLTAWVRDLSTVRRTDNLEESRTVGSLLVPVPAPPETDPRVPGVSAAPQTDPELDDLPF